MRVIPSLILLFFITASCSTIQDIALDRPEIEYQGFQFDQISMEGITLLFDFEIDNPNNREIKAQGYNYELLLEGSSLVSGERDEELSIQGRDKSMFQVPVTFTYSELRDGFGSLLGEKEIDFEIKSDVNLDLGSFGSRNVPVSHQGNLPVPQMPDVAFNGFDVKEIGFSGVDVELSFRIRNENDFSLHISSVDYTMVVNDSEWVSTGLEERYDIDSNSNSEYVVPITIGLDKAGTDAIQVIRNREPVTYEISGHAKVGADIPGFSRDAELPFSFSGDYQF